MATNRKETFTSPAGKALYPKLQEADTKFKPEGEFSVKLLLTEAQAAPFLEQCESAQEEAFQEKLEELKAKKPKMNAAKLAEEIKRAPLPVKPHTDPETGEETGEWAVHFKAKASGTTKSGERWERKIPMYDAKNQPISGKLPTMWSGSMLKVNYVVDPFCTALGAGVTLRIQAVQILKLVSGGARSAEEYGFEAEEGGYTYSEADMPEDGHIPFAADDAADAGQEDF